MVILEQHVATLCEELQVEPVYVPRGRRARAFPSERRVHVPTPKDSFSYLLNLHELGHVVLRDQGLKMKRLEREAWCWDYAIRNSIARVSFVDRQRIAANLLRYLLTAEQQRRAVPEEDSRFWLLLYWWLPYETNS